MQPWKKLVPPTDWTEVPVPPTETTPPTTGGESSVPSSGTPTVPTMPPAP